MDRTGRDSDWIRAPQIIVSSQNTGIETREKAPMLNGCWLYETPHGVFRIEWTRVGERGCFAVTFEQDLLGCYETATAALTSLVQGETQKPRCGLDIRRLGLPPSVVSWTFCPAGHESSTPDSLRRAPGIWDAAMKREGAAFSRSEEAPHREAGR